MERGTVTAFYRSRRAHPIASRTFLVNDSRYGTAWVLTNKRGVRLVILQQQFDTGTPAGKLALTMFAAFAEFENSIRKARQQEGIARARMEGGKYQGRKPKLTPEQRVELRRRFETGENRSQLARDFGIDRVTVHRYCSATNG